MGRRIDEWGSAFSSQTVFGQDEEEAGVGGSIILRGQQAGGNTTLGTQMMNARVSALSPLNGSTSFGLMSLKLRTVHIRVSNHFHNYNYILCQFITDF